MQYFRHSIKFCASPSTTQHERSGTLPESNYFTSPSARVPDYFAVASLPPYSSSTMRRKDSVYSGGNDSNDYAYVEDFQRFAPVPPAQVIGSTKARHACSAGDVPRSNHLLPDKFHPPTNTQVIVQCNPQVNCNSAALMTSCSPGSAIGQSVSSLQGKDGLVSVRSAQQNFACDTFCQYGTLQ